MFMYVIDDNVVMTLSPYYKYRDRNVATYAEHVQWEIKNVQSNQKNVFYTFIQCNGNKI